MSSVDEKEQILELLQEVIDKGFLVVVEGIKDKRALTGLGVVNVLTLKRPLFAMVESIADKSKDVVILTDLDAEGKKLYAELADGLQRHGVRIHNKLREFLFKTKLRQIEGLRTYLRSSR